MLQRPLWCRVFRRRSDDRRGPVDFLTSTASLAGAYSCARQLSFAYNGPLCNIRRASDSAAIDLYPALRGVVDKSALMTFCAATTCFIAIEYDQTGNGNSARNTNHGDAAGGDDRGTALNYAVCGVWGNGGAVLSHRQQQFRHQRPFRIRRVCLRRVEPHGDDHQCDAVAVEGFRRHGLGDFRRLHFGLWLSAIHGRRARRERSLGGRSADAGLGWAYHRRRLQLRFARQRPCAWRRWRRGVVPERDATFGIDQRPQQSHHRQQRRGHVSVGRATFARSCSPGSLCRRRRSTRSDATRRCFTGSGGVL